MYLGLSPAHLLHAKVVTIKNLDMNIEALSSVSFDYQSVSKAVSKVYKDAEVLNVDTTNSRYDVETVKIPKDAQGNDSEFEMTYAVNKNGDYIGDVDTAKYLCDDLGINPEVAKSDNSVCTIGKSDKDNKWYGWSHRALYGFKRGSKVYPGHTAYKADSIENFKESLKDWYADEMYKDIIYTTKPNGIKVSYKIEPKDKRRKNIGCDHFHKFEKGRGTWTAKNMSDAKQMAMDFAESVSSASISDIENAEDVLSLSVAKQNVTKYQWFKYNADKKVRLNKHNRWHDIDLEKGDIVGFKLKADGKNYNMVSKEDTTIVFALDRKTVQRIIKSSRPYNGKVDNFKVVPGSMDYTKELNIKEVKSVVGKERTIIDEKGVPAKFRQTISEAVHVAVFQADASRRGYILAVGKTENAVKKIVTTRSGTNAPAVLFLLSKDNGLVKRALKTGWTRISEQQANILRIKGVNVKQFIPVRKT